jgi:hypothetical protein
MEGLGNQRAETIRSLCSEQIEQLVYRNEKQPFQSLQLLQQRTENV